MIFQLLLWLALSVVLGIWAYSDNKKRAISDRTIKFTAVTFGSAYILALITSSLNMEYVGIGLALSIAIALILRREIQDIDKVAIGMSFIAFPFVSLGAMGMYCIMHLVDIKAHGNNYYSAFITKYFIAFVIASMLAIPILMHW